jgi:molybdopterin-containing oxidoreductase family iron-sulfur binding subunit
LREARGPEYWRSLDELADTEEFQEIVRREFPQGASKMHDPVGRREFLKLMGASLALAGVTACTRQ